MLSARVIFGCLFALVLVCSSAGAAVYLVPSDRDLILDADAIVVGRVLSVTGEIDLQNAIATRIEIEIEEVLKGNLDGRENLSVVQEGGVFLPRVAFVSGSPTWVPGLRVLVFLDRNTAGDWTTWGMELGKFDYSWTVHGVPILVRGAHANEIVGWTLEGFEHRERPRLQEKFLAYIRAVIAGNDPEEDYYPGDERQGQKPPREPVSAMRIPNEGRREGGIVVHAHYPPSAYLMSPLRWNRFDQAGFATFYVNGAQPGYDSTGAAQRGLAAWTNDPSSNIDYRYGGATTAGFVEDGINSIVFNASSGVPAGAIAYARAFGGDPHTYKGETFYSTTEGDVIVRSGLSITQKALEQAVAHELGHTLGFRHSADAAPSTTAAVMHSVVNGAYGAVLQPWDREAASHVYGSTCTASFSDVPCSHAFYTWIETAFRNGVVQACSPGVYCPNNIQTRREMAVSLLRAKYGSGYVPPAAQGIFSDVSKTSYGADFIEQLYREGITTGCATGPLRYCPEGPVTRLSMAVFLLRTKYGSSYSPPAATGTFSDLPAATFGASFAEQLYREGITTGCATNPLRYCPSEYVLRSQMAKFLVTTFNLQ